MKSLHVAAMQPRHRCLGRLSPVKHKPECDRNRSRLPSPEDGAARGRRWPWSLGPNMC